MAAFDSEPSLDPGPVQPVEGVPRADLARLHGDAGHRFGNFPAYYDFHSVGDRLDLITADMAMSWMDGFEGVFTILDVGSNSGTLTNALHQE